MFQTIEEVARELATDVCKLEIVDFGSRMRWKDTRQIVAFRTIEGWIVIPDWDRAQPT